MSNEVYLDKAIDQLTDRDLEHHESYFELVWRRFRRSKASIFGATLVLMLMVLAVFAEFFSPNPISGIFLESSFIPPQRVHFVDQDGKVRLESFCVQL